MRWIICALVCSIGIVLAVWLWWAFNSVQIAHWALGSVFIPLQAGPWGDSFGAFNALFGALGFTAVIGTFLLQARSLRIQQEDLHRQRFEASFFELLGLSRELRRSVRFGYTKEYRVENKGASIPSTEDDGQRFIRAAVAELRYWISHTQSNDTLLDAGSIAEIYERILDARYGSRFAPYFRIIYTILRRISDDKVLTSSEKASYGNILRSQLGAYDLALLSMNALSGVSGDLKKFIVEFRLFKYMRQGSFRELIEAHYPPEAFTSRD